MSELINFPEDIEYVQKDVQGRAFVKMSKVFRYHMSAEGPNGQIVPGDGVVEREEEFYFFPNTVPNLEAILNLMNDGARVLGFGNFPAKVGAYRALAAELKTKTDLRYQDRSSDAYKAMRAQIEQDMAADSQAAVAGGKANGKGKAKGSELSDNV